MSCCVKIEPVRVSQWAGEFYAHSGGLGGLLDFPAQRSWWWTLYNPEQGFDETEGQETLRIRHNFDEAFDGIPWEALVEYPDELKVEAYELEGGLASFTFRAEFEDSTDCTDDPAGDRYGSGVQVLLKIRVCSPAKVKLSGVGNVANSGGNRPEGGALGYDYTAYDRLDAGIYHALDGVIPCDGSPFPAYPGGVSLLCGHEGDGTTDCSMIERSDCGTVLLCEGDYYLVITMATNDGQQHTNAYWEVNLQIECGESSLNCDAEEELESYMPCDSEAPCTPPEDPSDPQPGECGGGQIIPQDGDCFCDACTISGLRITLSGYSDSGCYVDVITGKQLVGVASNLNGTYVLIRDGSGGFELDLGEPSNCSDRGILVARTNTLNPIYTCSSYVNRITATLSCVLEGDEARWSANVTFFYGTYIEAAFDPCTPILSCDDSGIDGTCVNTRFETEVAHFNCCGGRVTYSNEGGPVYDGNSEFGLDELLNCNCQQASDFSLMKVEPIGYAGCEE